MSTKSSERSAGGRLVEVGKRVGLVQVVEIVDLTTPAQLVAAALDRAQRAGQDDLEVGQLGVDVVVDLAAHPGGLLGRVVDDPTGLGPRVAYDVGLVDE